MDLHRFPLTFYITGILLCVSTILVEPAFAHTGALRLSETSVSVPFWLYYVTGGGVVAASFLFVSFVTGRGMIHTVNSLHLPLWLDGRRSRRVSGFLKYFSLFVFVVILVVGVIGPHDPTANLAILLIWVGWWAGFTMSVYTIGNTWPLINPWRTLSEFVSRDEYKPYPEWLGTAPSILGLLLLVWIEVITPIGENPILLIAVILGYSIITVGGAALFGPTNWFTHVDPITRVFRVYGHFAPIQRTNDKLVFKLPGTHLTERTLSTDTTFIIALLWATTYDGLVSTPLWESIIRTIVGLGIPPLLVYFIILFGGFSFTLTIYKLAAIYSRRLAGTYVASSVIEARFAPALIPIAAGYHLAHFLGYFLSWLPAIQIVVLNPLNPPQIVVAQLPALFGGLELVFILVGHLFAVWVAHTISFDIFTGKLQPLRSQYPFILIMIVYTMFSMYLIGQPFNPPPYL